MTIDTKKNLFAANEIQNCPECAETEQACVLTDHEIVAVAKEILQKFKTAFEELAK